MGQPETRSLPCYREGGFTILEVVIALTIFALVMTGLATSTAIGLKLVARSNGRQLASQLATRELELLRQASYSNVGLLAAPTAADPGTLDEGRLDVGAQKFLVPDGPATPEAVIVVAGTGAVNPRVTTESVGGFQFTIHRYVTWVDDPAISSSTMDYKRATVAVQWRASGPAGGPSRVVLSSLFSPGVVTF